MGSPWTAGFRQREDAVAPGPGRKGCRVCLQSVSEFLFREEKAQGREREDVAQQGECTPASEQTQPR